MGCQEKEAIEVNDENSNKNEENANEEEENEENETISNSKILTEKAKNSICEIIKNNNHGS